MPKLGTQYTLPETWASALINGDYSGYDKTETAAIEEFLAYGLAQGESVVSCSEEPFFSWQHDASDFVQGATCLEFHTLIN